MLRRPLAQVANAGKSLTQLVAGTQAASSRRQKQTFIVTFSDCAQRRSSSR